MRYTTTWGKSTGGTAPQGLLCQHLPALDGQESLGAGSQGLVGDSGHLPIHAQKMESPSLAVPARVTTALFQG